VPAPQDSDAQFITRRSNSQLKSDILDNKYFQSPLENGIPSMTETLYKSSDVLPNQPEHLLANNEESVNPALVQRAQQIGTALGKTVSNLRKAREKLHELSDKTADSAVTRLNDLAVTVKAKAHELSEEVATRASELSNAVVQKAGELGAKTRAGVFRARRRANQISRGYPIHTLVAVGMVGILVGIGIRTWRANRAY
jgi:uncharacterized phage infection (PIP) family protein YhgE